MIAYCGLDCVECEAYIATQNKDFETLTALAKKWGENHNTSYRPEDIECGGCQSDRLNTYCNRCGVRDCGLSHGFETCAECQDYPCDKLSQEWKSWHMADWTKAKAALDERSSESDLVLPGSDETNYNREITKIIHDSFGWALTKDRALFESIFAKDDDFFTYYPDSKSTVVGWNQFESYLDRWIDPRNKAKGFDIRDLRIVISKTGEVAWFSAIVDDEGEFDGRPWGIKDVRWTGVLERRGGSWKICQQHMSEANDSNSK